MRDYIQPTIDLIMVEVEAGFELTNSQQAPSPWEDM